VGDRFAGVVGLEHLVAVLAGGVEVFAQVVDDVRLAPSPSFWRWWFGLSFLMYAGLSLRPVRVYFGQARRKAMRSSVRPARLAHAIRSSIDSSSIFRASTTSRCSGPPA
jgi:hypothetical protein